MPTDLKTWHMSPKMYRSGPFSAEVSDVQKKDGETIPRRNVNTKDALKATPAENIATVFDILHTSAEKYGNAKAVGYRRFVKEHQETKMIKKVVDGKEQAVPKKWTYYELSEYTYLSFVEFEKLALQIGAGLRKLGMQKGDKLQLFASTSVWWLASAHGAITQSMPIVTAYDTLGEEGIKHSMIQTKSRAIYVDPHLLPQLVKPLKEATDIEFIIYNSKAEVKQEHIDKLKSEHPRLTIQSFDELQSLGDSNPTDPVRPQPDDLCCIMYTSGSTGAPKGVLLKHKNVVAAVAGVDVIVGPYIGPGDGLLAYLPLAHIYEFVFENATLFWGGTMGYGNIRTISDTSVRNCKGDIREFRPSVMVGVPAVWETVKKGIIGRVMASNFVVRSMFWSALYTKNVLLSSGIPGTAILDYVVFSSIKEATGGRLRVCMNGGGPIAKDTQNFISMAIAPMIGGYGLTETTAMGLLCDPAAWTDKAVGEITGSVEIKLVDYADAGYFSTSKPPQGEIWIRGPPVTEGYLDLEEENKEAFTEDGWFKTGDIGEFDINGLLRLIDRKKNLIKTLNGEYIALEKLESVYRSVPVVHELCVYARDDKARPIALVVPVEAALQKLAKQHGIEARGLTALVKNKKLNGVVLKELQNTGKASGLAGFEILEGVALVEEEWTPENNLVTSARKVNRKNIREKYGKEIDNAYASAS